MSWKRVVVTSLCWLFIGVWIGNSYASNERRFILYGLMRELKPGMPKSEAQVVIQRHQAPFIKYHVEPNDVVLWVSLPPKDFLQLYMHFDQERLVKAGIVGEDGPHDVPKDAPKFE